MNQRGWDELIDLVDQKYGISKHDKSEQELEDNRQLKKTIETIEFDKDGVKYRVERITSPAIIDKKTYYHRSGVQNRIENIYDESETSAKLVFSKQISGQWMEVTPEQLFS